MAIERLSQLARNANALGNPTSQRGQAFILELQPAE